LSIGTTLTLPLNVIELQSTEPRMQQTTVERNETTLLLQGFWRQSCTVDQKGRKYDPFCEENISL